MLWWFAQTTLIAGAMAALAAVVGRWKRIGPEAAHLLWLLVLLKLAIPPLVAWPWSLPDAWPARAEPAPAMAPLPLPDPPAAPIPVDRPLPEVASTPPLPEEVPAAAEVAEVVPEPVPEPMPIAPTPEPVPAPVAHPLPISHWNFEMGNWESTLLALWLAGSVAVVVRRGSKVFRFHRALAGSKPAPDWLVDEAWAIGDRVGVRPPPVVMTQRVATPLLWCLGRPRLVLPEPLIGRLGADRWPGILAHELAHLARGDHWVVRLELLVEAVWWWNPLFWITRRKLREHAEVACDARVVRALPERRHAYAEALVDVCEHIARSAPPTPALGVGGSGGFHPLEGRLHMILRDPIPRRPGRRAAVLAALLAALAMPAWTLGQQQPGPPASKPEAPKPIKEQVPDAPNPKPKPNPEPAPAPQPVTPAPIAEPPSIDAIRAALAGKLRWEGLDHLSFRLVVAERGRSRQASGYGGQGGFGAGPVANVTRSTAVRIRVADVVLGPMGRSRSDVLDVASTPEGPADPAGPPRPPVAWNRRFVALDAEGYTTLAMAWDKAGPVPFRWLEARGRQAFGDSLTAAFFRGPNNGVQGFYSSDLDREIEPLDPRPRNVLEMYGVPTFLKADITRAEVIGLDKVDGRDAVRIAWSANADFGLRGLCWVAPELGYAVVSFNATQDASPAASAGRRTWRRRSTDFVKVTDHLWLPRKVFFEEAQLDLTSGEPLLRREREMIFEDYRADQTVADGIYRPKLTIRDLDDRSGNFTADPPALPSGLVDRLARAVGESPFGQPGTERTVEEPEVRPDAAKPGGQPGKPTGPFGAKPGGQPGKATGYYAAKPGEQAGKSGNPSTSAKPNAAAAKPALRRNYADIVANVDEAPTGRLMLGTGQGAALKMAKPLPAPKPDQPADAAKADPGIIAKPEPGFEDPIPTVDPKTDDPIEARPLAGNAEAVRLFKRDPKVIDLTRRIAEANKKVDDAKRIVGSVNDPAVASTQRKLDTLKSQYEALWNERSSTILWDLRKSSDDAEVLQARRDGKAASVLRAEAQRALAKTVVARNARLKAINANMVSEEDSARADAELAVADADLAASKAELAEADALLNQTKRRIPAQAAEGPASPVADARPGTLAELRDEIELMEVHLQGKQAELRAAEATAHLAESEAANTRRMADRQGVSKNEVELFDDKARVAQAQRDAKKAEVLESETRLKQAKRRLEAAEGRLKREVDRAKSRLESSEKQFKNGEVPKSTVDADKAAYDELMIQLDPKDVPAAKEDADAKLEDRQARLRADIVRAKARLDWSENMLKKGHVSEATRQANRLTYENVLDEMKRLDPKSVPDPTPARKEDSGVKPPAGPVGEKP